MAAPKQSVPSVDRLIISLVAFIQVVFSIYALIFQFLRGAPIGLKIFFIVGAASAAFLFTATAQSRIISAAWFAFLLWGGYRQGFHLQNFLPIFFVIAYLIATSVLRLRRAES